jgi:hypothetical protein
MVSTWYKVTIKAIVKDVEMDTESKKTIVIFVQAENYIKAELEAQEYAKEHSERFVVATITKTKIEGVDFIDEENHGFFYQVKVSFADLENDTEHISVRLINGNSVLEVAEEVHNATLDSDTLLEVVLTPAEDIIKESITIQE